jgi:hypothetical protein
MQAHDGEPERAEAPSGDNLLLADADKETGLVVIRISFPLKVVRKWGWDVPYT